MFVYSPGDTSVREIYKVRKILHLSDAVRCVLKRCSLGVPLKASIDKNAKEWKGPAYFKASCLEEVLWP